VSELDMTGWTDKDSKLPRFRALYEQDDFLTAYAKHTDLRVRDDPKWAIGRGDEWETHGKLQLKFLRELGLKPAHALLDIGCGVGRAARRFVPYLEPEHYVGTDISPAALRHAEQLAVEEGWADRQPRFFANADLALIESFDYLWAHSVFTHLPAEQIKTMLRNARPRTRIAFAFTFKERPQPIRTGLKQFGYPFAFIQSLARDAGFDAVRHSMVFPATQPTIVCTPSPA
jgi:SAM-dependent methyltransferase